MDLIIKSLELENIRLLVDSILVILCGQRWKQNKKKDGYVWLHVDAYTNSNLGEIHDLWIVIDYLGEQYMSLEDEVK